MLHLALGKLLYRAVGGLQLSILLRGHGIRYFLERHGNAHDATEAKPRRAGGEHGGQRDLGLHAGANHYEGVEGHPEDGHDGRLELVVDVLGPHGSGARKPAPHAAFQEQEGGKRGDERVGEHGHGHGGGRQESDQHCGPLHAERSGEGPKQHTSQGDAHHERRKHEPQRRHGRVHEEAVDQIDMRFRRHLTGVWGQDKC